MHEWQPEWVVEVEPPLRVGDEVRLTVRDSYARTETEVAGTVTYAERYGVVVKVGDAERFLSWGVVRTAMVWRA